MTDTHDKELVEAVADQLRCAALNQSPSTRARLARKAISAARPHLEKKARVELLRDLLSDWPVGSDFGRAINTYLKVYAAEHNIDLTTEEKG